MEKSLKIKTIDVLKIIILYYVARNYNLFPYALSLSLYHIIISSFKHISINNGYSKKLDNLKKIIRITILSIITISLGFLILSIILSDAMNTILNTNDMFLVFLLMGLSVASEPLISIYSEYLSLTKRKSSTIIYNGYYILEAILFVIISLFSFRIFKLPNSVANSLLYLSKIISLVLISILWYFITKNDNIADNHQEKHQTYKLLKKIISANIEKSLISIVKNSYQYISIILVYLVLTTRYNYSQSTIFSQIPIVYLYVFTIVDYYLELITKTINKACSKNDVYNKLYYTFKIMLPLAIIISITSPMICQIVFNSSVISAYLSIFAFTAIFIKMYDLSFEKIVNKKILNFSLIIGVILKVITTIPLINAFYRIGYNLIYGDILSTALCMTASIIVNQFYLKSKYVAKEKLLGKILMIIYDNILLSIVLIAIQFILPLNNITYLKSLIYLPIYLIVGVLFLNIKNKKRG